MGDQSTTMMMMSSMGGAGLCCVCFVSILGALAFATLSQEDGWMDPGVLTAGKDASGKDISACFAPSTQIEKHVANSKYKGEKPTSEMFSRIGWVDPDDSMCAYEAWSPPNPGQFTLKDESFQYLGSPEKWKWMPAKEWESSQQNFRRVGTVCGPTAGNYNACGDTNMTYACRMRDASGFYKIGYRNDNSLNHKGKCVAVDKSLNKTVSDTFDFAVYKSEAK
jgi:hypothetical protein